MYSEPLVTFVMLFIIAKLMGLRLPFYSAAVFAVAGLYAVESAFNGYQFGPFFTETTGLRLAIALVLFFLLDRAEDKAGRWLLTFVATFAVFAFVF